MRRGGNPDANNQDIADLAVRLGATVTITTGVGWDFPDQVWGVMGLTVLVEVTNPDRKPTKKDKERKARQAAFRERWRGGLCVELKTGADVFRLFEQLKRSCSQCGRIPAAEVEATGRKDG